MASLREFEELKLELKLNYVNCTVYYNHWLSVFSFSLALTKLDILDVFSEIKVGVAYKVDNQTIPHFPGKSSVFFCFSLLAEKQKL